MRLRFTLFWIMLTLPVHAARLGLVVDHRAGDAPLMLGSLRSATTDGETFSVSRASYLLSGFGLQRADGSWLEMPEAIAWMDAGKARSTAELPDVPAGIYTALRFHVGIDAATNAANPAKYPPEHPLNTNLNGLYWTMAGGYIFMALEGSWRVGNAEPSGYSFHLARDPNRTAITLKGSIDLTGDAQATIGFDVPSLLKGISLAKDGTSTHSQAGDPIAAALVANLPGSFTLHSIASSVPELARPSKIKPLYMPAKFTPYRFTMSNTFPMPALPRDNPLIEERVALGEMLFKDRDLSRDGTISCASCHLQSNAFSDPRRFSLGVADQIGARQSMPLINLAWKNSFFWDGRAPTLRAQALIPIEDHIEMDEKLDSVVAKLEKTSKEAFGKAFDSDVITPERIGLAIESYLLTLTSHDSKFDRALRGEVTLNAEEKRGFELFILEREPRMGTMGADCFHCHGGPLFTDHAFRNNGLAIDEADVGRARVTGKAIDRGTFATPSLRNVAVTAPYMHDGRFATLEAVIDHYSDGVVMSPTLDPNLAKHPGGGLKLNAEEKKALLALLRALTDRAFGGE
jgi:cytochrome c peroxidase